MGRRNDPRFIIGGASLLAPLIVGVLGLAVEALALRQACEARSYLRVLIHIWISDRGGGSLGSIRCIRTAISRPRNNYVVPWMWAVVKASLVSSVGRSCSAICLYRDLVLY